MKCVRLLIVCILCLGLTSCQVISSYLKSRVAENERNSMQCHYGQICVCGFCDSRFDDSRVSCSVTYSVFGARSND